jgi:hypothetical protein
MRVVEWKVWPNPEENVVQATYSFHAFVRLNSSSILEVVSALRTTRNRITVLEAELKTVKVNSTLDFKESTKVVETLNNFFLNKELQRKNDEMNAEFEIREQTQRDTHAKELECIKMKPDVEIKQLKREHNEETTKLQKLT